MREQVQVADDRVPGAELITDKNAILMERVTLQELLRFLARGGFVDDQGATVVGERAGGSQLAALFQAGEILTMDRADFGDPGLVLRVLDDGREFHGCSFYFARAGTRSAGKLVRVNQACAPKRTPENPRSHA